METKNLSAYQDFSNEKFTKRVIYNEGDSVVFVLNFLGAQELPTHKHPGTQVYILVLQGGGTMIADGMKTAVKKGDVVHCLGDEMFSFKNTEGEATSLYVMLNKLPSDNYAQNI